MVLSEEDVKAVMQDIAYLIGSADAAMSPLTVQWQKELKSQIARVVVRNLREQLAETE